jgi:hypothetical protein
MTRDKRFAAFGMLSTIYIDRGSSSKISDRIMIVSAFSSNSISMGKMVVETSIAGVGRPTQVDSGFSSDSSS